MDPVWNLCFPPERMSREDVATGLAKWIADAINIPHSHIHHLKAVLPSGELVGWANSSLSTLRKSYDPAQVRYLVTDPEEPDAALGFMEDFPKGTNRNALYQLYRGKVCSRHKAYGGSEMHRYAFISVEYSLSRDRSSNHCCR